MLSLAATLLRWPQGRQQVTITAFSAALAFGLSPLVLLWSRIAVSDALFSACLAITLLLFWRGYAAAEPARCRWWLAWAVLGLAVLAKGPVALVLCVLTLILFVWRQADGARLLARLKPWPGLLITALVAVPWYAAELWVEGQPFWDSFFGYHNLQRFTGVVNNHLQPWWFFLPVLVVASLPFTPLLLQGLLASLRCRRASLPPEQSLQLFAACWLLAVLGFFTLAATKLPSYWIPATPAAALLVALAAQARPPRWALDPADQRSGAAHPAGRAPGQWPRAAGRAVVWPQPGARGGSDAAPLERWLAVGSATAVLALCAHGPPAAVGAGGWGAPAAGSPHRRRCAGFAPPQGAPGDGGHPQALFALLHPSGGAFRRHCTGWADQPQ
jgi:4-amino-4-deoxy-L-arabinose transferase-like glycosyltransferase